MAAQQNSFEIHRITKSLSLILCTDCIYIWAVMITVLALSWSHSLTELSVR